MLMEAGMALEPCQYDHCPDDEPRRRSLLSESDSDLEDTKGATSAMEPHKMPPIDKDFGENMSAPHRAPRLGELSTDSTMDGSQQEFFDAPDQFLASTDDGGKTAPTIESDDMTPLANNSMSSEESNSCDGKSIECEKCEDETQNSIHCKDFIENHQFAELSGQLHSTTECIDNTEQLYSIAKSENNNQPHSSRESEDIGDRQNSTDSTEMSDQAHTPSQNDDNTDQLHCTRESKDICHQVQTAMASETVHQPSYIIDSTDGSEKPNDRVECEEVGDHSIAESKQASDQTSNAAKSENTSDQTNNTTLSESIIDQHKTTEAKDLSDQRDTKIESEVTCSQQVNLKDSKMISNQCKKNAEPETIYESIKMLASDEICYLPHNATVTASVSGNPHSTAEHKEDCAQWENNREFEELNEQTHSTTESKDSSCHSRSNAEPEEIAEQINTTREADEEVKGQLHNTTKCEEVIDQLHDITKSEEESTELCNTTKLEEINDFPHCTVESEEVTGHATELAQISDKPPHHATESVEISGQSLSTTESEGIGGQPQNHANCGDQLHSTTDSVETSNRLHTTTQSVDTVDQSCSATEAKETVNQSSNNPDSENGSNQTYKSKGSKENNDRQDSMEVIDHSNTPHLSTVSAECRDQLNSTDYPIERTADLSISVKSKVLKEVSDKSELRESIQRPQSNVQSSEIEAMCQDNGFTTLTLNDLPQNVNESIAIPQTCIDSQEDIGHEKKEPIASDTIHPQDTVFTDTHVVNKDDSEHYFNERAIQAAENILPIEDTSLESNVTEPSETTTQSHQFDMSLVTNDGPSSNLVFRETHDELQNGTESAGSSQDNPTNQDHISSISVQPFLADATVPFVETTHLLDFICLPCSDVEAMERDDPGFEGEGQVMFNKNSNTINVYYTGPAGMAIHAGLPTEDVGVQEISGILSEQHLLTSSIASGPDRTDFLEHDYRISLNKESESAVVHPSSSNESLAVCPQSPVSYKQSLDKDQTAHSSVVESQTVVQIVDQTQNRGPSPQIPNASFPSGWTGGKPTPCEMRAEVSEMQEPITEEHESQTKPQRPISMTFEPHSECLQTDNFGERLRRDSDGVPMEGAIPEQEVIDHKSNEDTNDELAWNVPDGQQGNLHRGNSELEPKPHRLVHKTSSTEGGQAPFYVTEEWREVLQPPNQRVYFRLKQEVGIDRALSLDSREIIPLPPETKSESVQLDPPSHDLNVLVEPNHDEFREDTQETDGIAVEVNPVKISTDFMKFLGHVPKFFGAAVEELGELPPRSSQGLEEVDYEICQTSDISSCTSAGHETHQDSSIWDSTVNIEGINIPLTGKQNTPIHFFNPLLELSTEETEAFFESDIVAHLKDDSTMFITPATPPVNHFDTSLPSHTPISHITSMKEYDVYPDTKQRSTSLQVADVSPMPEFSPSTENVFISPQPSPVTVIAGSAETESESRSSWMPTWKVPDESVMQLLSKKLISPKLSRSGSKMYRTGGIAAMNKDTQNRHSTPVLVSHSQLADQRTLGVTEIRELNRATTKTPKPFHINLAPTQSKVLFRQVVLPEASEEAPQSDQEDSHQVGKIKSGRLRVRDDFEQHTSSNIDSGALNRPTVQIFDSEGEFSQAKPYTSPVKTQNESERTPSNLAAVDSRSQEDLTSGTDKSQAWRRKGVRKTIMVVSQDDEPHDEEMDLTTSDPVHLRDRNFANQASNIMRRRSKLIDSSRLLYQEYSDVALNQAIERQKRTETFLEESEPSSPRLRRKLMSSPDSYLQRLSVSSSASLWQDIPMIRGTSALLSMTREEQKLQEAKFELIMSEASYLRSLNIAVDHFQHSPELQTLLSNQERQWLFSRLQEVRDVSSDFLFDLEEKFEDNMYTFNVCDVVLSHTPAIRKVYLPYVTNQSYQDQTFRQLLNGNPRFQQVLEKLESDPVCQRLSLKSFLILPFQRITRLKLLVQNILKRTRPGSREEAQATQAYNLMEKLIKDCNENVQRMRSTEELIYLSQKIEFECKIFPLISQSRRLVKQGELVELEYGSPLSFKWKVITRPIYLHLFNDCLLLSRRREGARYVVFDHARASKVRGEKCEIKLHGTNKNIFRLTLQENNQGRRVEFLLRTETQSEKLRWISALAPPRKKPDLMECHDNPQVQCLKSYKARENDELSLEKADVIMVTQQSKDGWIEGIRLSDGEHGWFRVENIEDISNRHVRLRNLKEEHRVQCARAKLMPLSNRR